MNNLNVRMHAQIARRVLSQRKKIASLRCAVLVAVIALALGLPHPVASAEPPSDWVGENLGNLVEVYHHFHQTPELSFHEKETAARLAREIRATGTEVTEGIGGHGIVGMLRNGEGPTVMLRCDLDALPVTEETGLVYASKVKTTNDDGIEVGVMHACGHDLHITNLIGVARYLASHRDQWQGTAMFIGQPAEERGAGAKAMLGDQLFERFAKPDYALAMHVDPSLACGKVNYRPGYACANVDSVDITMKGRGGHGAYPHATIDPVVLASHLVIDLQTIVSREVKPTEPAVITVGAISGGTKHNVIGNECHLKLTVRSYAPKVRKQLLVAIERKAKAVAQGAGAPDPVVEISEGTPSLLNDAALAERAGDAFRRVVGSDNVGLADPSMGGEDFSRYGAAGVPILLYRVGAVEAKRLAGFERFEQPPPSLHSPLFYPDAEKTLTTSIPLMAGAAMELMPRKP